MAETPRRKTWARFSLREALFGVTALAAILALLANARPFSTTSFFDSFDDEQTLVEACDDLGITYSLGGRSSGSWRSPDLAQRESRMRMRGPLQTESGRVVAQLQRRVRASLREHRCGIHGHGYSGDPATNEVRDFQIYYRKGNTRGHICVYSLPDTGDHWQILMLMHEY